MSKEDLYKNADYAMMFGKFEIYTDHDKIEYAVNLVDKVLKSKLIEDELFIPGIASQEVLVTAINCKKNNNYIMEVKTELGGKDCYFKYYEAGKDGMHEITEDDYKKLAMINKDPSKKVVVEDIEYSMKNKAKVSDDFDYYVQEVDDCIKNPKIKKDSGIIRKIKHWMNKIESAVYKLVNKFTVNKTKSKYTEQTKREISKRVVNRQDSMYEPIETIISEPTNDEKEIKKVDSAVDLKHDFNNTVKINPIRVDNHISSVDSDRTLTNSEDKGKDM